MYHSAQARAKLASRRRRSRRSSRHPGSTAPRPGQRCILLSSMPAHLGPARPAALPGLPTAHRHLLAVRHRATRLASCRRRAVPAECPAPAGQKTGLWAGWRPLHPLGWAGWRPLHPLHWLSSLLPSRQSLMPLPRPALKPLPRSGERRQRWRQVLQGAVQAQPVQPCSMERLHASIFRGLIMRRGGNHALAGALPGWSWLVESLQSICSRITGSRQLISLAAQSAQPHRGLGHAYAPSSSASRSLGAALADIL